MRQAARGLVAARLGVDLVGPVAGGERDHRLARNPSVSARCAPTAVSRRPPSGRSRPGVVEAATTSTSRVLPLASRSGRAAAAARSALGVGGASEHRPLVVERDPRPRARAGFARPEGLAPDVVFANEDEDERSAARFPADWILKRGARGASFDGDERQPFVRMLSIRPGQETRSRRAGSWAGRSSRWKRPHAVSARPERCPAAVRLDVSDLIGVSDEVGPLWTKGTPSSLSRRRSSHTAFLPRRESRRARERVSRPLGRRSPGHGRGARRRDPDRSSREELERFTPTPASSAPATSPYAPSRVPWVRRRSAVR